jgi:polar amino acid transport system substrate-binding protein
LLEGSGIVIDIANDGLQAVDCCRKKQYDLILMDLQMPNMDGYEATKRIREMDKNIPIIALTANVMAGDVEKTRIVGMNEHLNKPIDVEKLYEVLLRYLAGRAAGEERHESGEEATLKVASTIFKTENFQFIDVQKGLSHLAGNENLYAKILQSFIEEFQGVKLNLKDYDNSARIIHTLKGLSANIGALSLNEICRELEERPDESLLPQLYDNLQQVINEIERNTATENEVGNESAEEISDEIYAEKIEALKIALSRRRTRECSPIIEELKHCQIDRAQRELLVVLEGRLKARDFKAALALLDGER